MLLTVNQMVDIYIMIKFLTKSIESSLCDYSDEYISYRKFANAGDNPIQRNQPFAPATQVAFVHRSKIVEQKSIILLLMKQILSILQCLCTI